MTTNLILSGHGYIGKHPSDTGYTGNVDETRIYNRALSANEINAHYKRRMWVASDTVAIDGNFATAGEQQVLGQGTGLLAINASGDTTPALTIVQGGAANAITTTSPVTIGKTKITGALDLPYKSIAAAYTVTTADYFLECNSTSAIFTVTLPTAVGCAGREYVFVKNNALNDITIDTFNVETINGAATYILSAQWSKVTIVSNGTNWIIKI